MIMDNKNNVNQQNEIDQKNNAKKGKKIIKEFTKLLLTGIYLIPDKIEDEEAQRCRKIMLQIEKIAGAKAVDWSNENNKSTKYGKKLFEEIISEMLELDKITTEEAEYFIDMVRFHAKNYND